MAKQPFDEYIVGVVGLRLADIGGRGASLDASTTTEDDQEVQRLKKSLKNAASLLRSGHEPLVASSVELDQGKDGRTVFHFPKSDPITSREKSVEFRITTAGTKIQKKFVLKEMEYGGRLEL